MSMVSVSRLLNIMLPLIALCAFSLSGCFEGVPAIPKHLEDKTESTPSQSTEGASPSRLKEASTLNEEAVSQLEAGQAEKAIQTLEKAYTLAPNTLAISENMARALEADNQLPKARDAYEALSLKGELPETKRDTYLLRAVDLNIKLAEQLDEAHKWNERKVNDVLLRLGTAVDEDAYVERVDILRGYYNIDPKG
jgi:tetratricopeptide (TPR) repeat protein